MDELGFWKIAEKDPTRLALIDPSGSSMMYGELLAECNQLVHGFRALGLTKGDSVAVLMENEKYFLAIFMAISQAGMYLVPINWHLNPENISYIIDDSDAKLLISSEKYTDNAKQAAKIVGFPDDRVFSTGNNPDVRSYREIINGQDQSKPEDRCYGCVKTYTSGTTGRPKGVLRKFQEGDPEEYSVMTAMFMMMFDIQPHSNNVHLVTAPLYHIAPNQFATMSLNLGHSLILMGKWSPEETLRLIEKHRVTTAQMVPTMLNRLIRLPESVKKAADLSSLHTVIHSAAPCPVDLKKGIMEWWGPVLFEYYSASEGGGTLVKPNEWMKKPGTVGKPWPISHIKILDESKNELPSGQIGTIYIRMDTGQKFVYHGDKKKTEKAYFGDFFTADDVGYVDEDGYLFLTDRKSYMIIVGGVNIYPTEIESALSMHPKIEDNAVFGIPNEDLGEEIKAVIVLEKGIEQSEEITAEIMAYCAKTLGKFRTPHSIDYADKLPREATGKLIKHKIRDPFWKNQNKNI